MKSLSFILILIFSFIGCNKLQIKNTNFFQNNAHKVALYYEKNEKKINNFIKLYKQKPLIQYICINNSKISMLIQDRNLGIGKGYITKELYEEQDSSRVFLESLQYVKWSIADYEWLKASISELDVISIRLIPIFDKQETFYSIELHCLIDKTFFNLKLFSYDFNKEKKAFFIEHLEKKQKGGLVSQNVIWYYPK